MAHHIAELIGDAEAVGDLKTRQQRQREARQTITKLWSHRSSFENRINPIADLRPVLQVIRTLSPDNNSWIPRYFASSEPARKAYDVFRRLMIWSLIRKALGMVDVPNAIKRAKRTTKFQSKAERETIGALELWTGEIKPPEPRSTGKSVATGGFSEKRLRELGSSLIAEAREALEVLEKELLRTTKISDDSGMV
jgi:hypothetical protein